MYSIGTDALANTAQSLADYLTKNSLKVVLLNRLKSIHGPDDDIIEIDIDKTSNLRLLASDPHPGKFELIGIEKLINRGQLSLTIWHKLDGVTQLNILLPERPAPTLQD